MPARFKADGSWTSDTLDRLLDTVVETNRDKVAVIDNYGQITFGELREQADRVAAQLAHRGIGRGDVVTMQLPNRKEAAVVTYAVSRLGAIIHPVNVTYRQHELAKMMSMASTKALIVPTVFRNFDHAAMAAALRSDVASLGQVFVQGEGARHGLDRWEALLEPIDSPIASASEAEDVFLLLYTSGTSGTPKGVMHTHCTFLASFRAAKMNYDMSADDVVLTAMPVGMAMGFAGLISSLFNGGLNVLMEALNIDAAIELMGRYGVTMFSAVPTILSDLLKNLEGQPKSARPHLRSFGCTGAPASRELLLKAREVLGCRIVSLYGMSENIGHTITPPDAPLDLISTTVGKLYPYQEIAIMDEARQPCPVGVTGEIAARGALQFVGYYGEPELTAACHTPEDWFLTGDMGFMGEDGYLRINGRKKDLIIRGGLNIDPREIEDLLRGHPLVEDVAVVAIPDERLGEKVCACVIPASAEAKLTLADIVSYLGGCGISTQKLPERLEILNEFPLTVTMKVRKASLREMVAAKMASGN